MEPQDPKDVSRDTVLDFSGVVVVAVGLGYSGGVHSVPPIFCGPGPEDISTCGATPGSHGR
jgi:hypothetical protein